MKFFHQLLMGWLGSVYGIYGNVGKSSLYMEYPPKGLMFLLLYLKERMKTYLRAERQESNNKSEIAYNKKAWE